MTARVPTNSLFCACVSTHVWPIERAQSHLICEYQKAAHQPHTDSSLGFGWVFRLIDQLSEWPHSGHFHVCVLR